MVKSMTGFASRECFVEAAGGWTAAWELRSVNARGLDLRLRVPDWVPGLEQELRKLLSASLGRGSVSLSLRLTQVDVQPASVNETGLAAVLRQLRDVEVQAEKQGVTLARTSALEVLREKGVLNIKALSKSDLGVIVKALLEDFPTLISDFQKTREQEGHALASIIQAQITELEDLLSIAATSVKKRENRTKDTFRENMKRILDVVDVDQDRIAQELAILSIRSDVNEELDRLRTHCKSARELLSNNAPIGRKFDFLCQEFNREANTLCSKAGDSDLTQTGLAMKTVIDQMREQVQNVE